MQPVLLRQLLAHIMPYSAKQFEGLNVVDGEGALGRILQDGYDVLDQLPAFTPPFEKMWIELGSMDIGKLGIKHFAGVIVHSRDVHEMHDKPDFPADAKAEMDAKGHRVGWMVGMTVNVDTIPLSTGSSLGTMQLLLTEDGGLIAKDMPAEERTIFDIGEMTVNSDLVRLSDRDILRLSGATREELEQGARAIIGDVAAATLLVLGMLHCKNVELEEQVASAKVQRHRAKHGKKTEERFYTLKVTGKGARAGSMALRVPSGARNAMHWCRGHFRKYSEDAPLFGKIVGTFWVDAHVRGDRHEGAVNKAYAVDFTKPIPHGRSE